MSGTVLLAITALQTLAQLYPEVAAMLPAAEADASGQTVTPAQAAAFQQGLTTLEAQVAAAETKAQAAETYGIGST
jgi:hypothetical protein